MLPIVFKNVVFVLLVNKFNLVSCNVIFALLAYKLYLILSSLFFGSTNLPKNVVLALQVNRFD
jgi:ABC-type proline/glycine betaine transport system permease subunit